MEFSNFITFVCASLGQNNEFLFFDSQEQNQNRPERNTTAGTKAILGRKEIFKKVYLIEIVTFGLRRENGL